MKRILLVATLLFAGLTVSSCDLLELLDSLGTVPSWMIGTWKEDVGHSSDDPCFMTITATTASYTDPVFPALNFKDRKIYCEPFEKNGETWYNIYFMKDDGSYSQGDSFMLGVFNWQGMFVTNTPYNGTLQQQFFKQ